MNYIGHGPTQTHTDKNKRPQTFPQISHPEKDSQPTDKGFFSFSYLTPIYVGDF